MSRSVSIKPMDAEAFAAFGDLIEVKGDPDKIINQGLCGRYHDRAHFDFPTAERGSAFSTPSRAACR